MGVIYEKNTENCSKALGYFIEAFEGLLLEAQNGDVLSQRMISCYYLFGTRGVKQDMGAATYWLRCAAIGDNAEAQYNLGESYLTSKGVEVDVQKAKYWLIKSLKNGYFKAQKMLDEINVGKPYNCLNLCDLIDISRSSKEYCIEFERLIKKFQPQRVYLGSYFCGNYCLSTMDKIDFIVDICRKNSIMISFVIPIIPQRILGQIKQKLEKIAHTFINVIDEVTVNDYAMLDWVGNNLPFDISLGRLFIKDPRDQRIAESREITQYPLFINSQIFDCLNHYCIVGIEIDQIYSEFQVDNNYEEVIFVIHSPYCYQTTGQICLYASIHKQLQEKFRANCTCNFECMKMYISYSIDEGEYLRYGRAIYYKANNSIIKGIQNKSVRNLYWTFEDLEGRYENISATEEQ